MARVSEFFQKISEGKIDANLRIEILEEILGCLELKKDTMVRGKKLYSLNHWPTCRLTLFQKVNRHHCGSGLVWFVLRKP